MSDPDPEFRPSPSPLEYRSVEDDRKPGEAWKVLAFMGGMIAGIFLSLVIGGVCVAGAASSRPSNGLRIITVLIGLAFFGLAIGAVLLLVRASRHRLEAKAFLLGLLCGGSIACLLEGLCFTAIGLSQ